MLLTARISSYWLALTYAKVDYHQCLDSLRAEIGDCHQKRIDHAHHRYLWAIKALVVVRRLQVSARHVNISERQLNVAGSGHLALVPLPNVPVWRSEGKLGRKERAKNGNHEWKRRGPEYPPVLPRMP